VLIALITNKKLYIANLGICRALLVKNDVVNNVLRVIQITTDHNLNNEDELLRLCGLGLDAQSLRGEIFATRCIGSYLGKGGYKDSEVLSQSFGEPISSVPEIIGPVSLDDQCRFLLMMSGGLCKVLTQLFSEDLTIVNKEIVQIVVQQFNRQSTLGNIKENFYEQYLNFHFFFSWCCSKCHQPN
jgi:TAK1-binding protein 1